MDDLLSHAKTIVTGRGYRSQITRAGGLGWGLMGGLVGTSAMDLCVMGVFSAAGLSILHLFSNIGDTVARFFAVLGLEIAGGAPLGVATQYLIGPAIGASFGAIVARVDILGVSTWKRGVMLTVLYVEAVGQPLIATMPIFLKWTLPESVLWYCGALLAHMITGAVLGLVISYGLHPAGGPRH